MKYIEILIPAILTILGNIAFYKFIKTKSEQSIHKYSIAYSGIFMERLSIYRTLLEKIFDLKISLSEHISDDKTETEELLKNFNDFIKFSRTNEPLLSDSLSVNLRKLDKEFRMITHQTVTSINANYDDKKDKGDIKDFTEILKKAQAKNELLQKVYQNDILKKIENDLIKDMKTDFHIKKI
jgi:hypothetical protein